MFSKIQKCRDIISKEGLVPLIKRAFVYRKYYLYEKALDKTNRFDFVPKIENFGFGLKIVYTAFEVDRLIAEGFDFSFCQNIQYIKELLNKGTILFCVFVGKELSHISWLAMDNDTIIDPFFQRRPRQNAGYIGPCDTKPTYRGFGLYPFVLEQICKFLKKNGKSIAVISTAKSNFASVRGITKAGFTVCSEGYNLKVGFWEFWKEKKPK